MIWLWIALAVSISIALCYKRNICWYHYIWLFLPVEHYGLHLAGAIIKPYMVFGAIVVLALWMKTRVLTIDSKLFALLFCAFLTDILNGLAAGSMMQHIQLAICGYIFYSYSQLIDTDTDYWRQIEDVCIALLIGFGLVFIIASFVPRVGGASTIDRFADGIYLGFSQYGGGYAYRLRGFTIDPNACITILLPGFCYAFFRFDEHKGKDKLRDILAIGIYIYNIILTNSRMALLFTVVCFLFLLISMYKKSNTKIKWHFGIVSVIVAFVLVDISWGVSQHLFGIIADQYLGRASLTDEAGRITIWIDNMSRLFETNKWLFGVGQNQIQMYTRLGMPCHNTFLECVCGMGIFVGTAMSIYILSPLTRVTYKLSLKSIKYDYTLPLYLAYGSVCMCLLAVDHLFNPTLWILLFLLKTHDTSDYMTGETGTWI